MKKNIVIYDYEKTNIKNELDECVQRSNFIQNLKARKIRFIFKYRCAKFIVKDFKILSKPIMHSIVLKFISTNGAYFEDEKGNHKNINFRLILCLIKSFIQDFLTKKGMLNRINNKIDELNNKRNASRYLNLEGIPLYLRTDLCFGLVSGGSVGHIAGVLNNLDSFVKKPIFFTSDFIPTTRDDIEKYIILPDGRYWDFKEIPSINYNNIFSEKAKGLVDDKKISLIYQRYSLNNFSGVELAQYYQVPFVLEYNGSEVWIAKNWGKPLKYEELSMQIEMLNLNYADLIVVVSQPMKDELINRGINEDKILVNPNGVNPHNYSPNIDGKKVRERYQLENKIVLGFIGTFGMWHGAEVLAEAFGKLLNEYPQYKEFVRLMMIGDGMTMPMVKRNLERYDIKDYCVLTGNVPQQQGPKHLAACDILISPHVPNSDGTPFFGSPTKLFEYMSMGKGIVASDLDQIGKVLEHRETAFMVDPGNVNSLLEGIKELIDNEELRLYLGKNAREEAVNKHTWNIHTERIIKNLIKKYE